MERRDNYGSVKGPAPRGVLTSVNWYNCTMNTLEIIEEMNANPALVEELRAILLTREILELPKLVAGIDQRLDRLAALAERHEERLDSIDQRLDRLAALAERHEETLAELVALTRRHDERLDGIDQRLDGIDGRLDGIDGRLDSHDDKLGQLVGDSFEAKWRENAPAYLGSHGFRKLRVISKAVLADILDELNDKGLLSEDDREDILNVDSVATATRKADSTEIYILTELSSRLHVDDVERVVRRASLLAAAISKSCVQIVAGASIDDDALELANSSGVIVVTPKEWARKVA